MSFFDDYSRWVRLTINASFHFWMGGLMVAEACLARIEKV